MSNPYRQYQKTAVTTASREKILLLLYEGAIRFTKQAIDAMNDKRIADKGKYISKATAILSELMATLDFKAGGELAIDLENLYVFMIDKMIEGNINNDVSCLENVERLLNTLYVAWKDVIENPRPDGVPSKKLQPEQYKEFMDNPEKQEEIVTPPTKNATMSQPETMAAPKLKIIA
ncbi:MAG: flagellar export chaperone FliS [Bdellovibrionota bacterium]